MTGQNIWNINIKQANDLYIYIDKSPNTEKTIKSVTLQNFNCVKSPNKGNLAIYRPTGELNNLYTYSQQNYLNESIIYSGGQIDDLKTLEIANNGGIIACRISLDNLGTFISNDSTEITYDASLLNNIGITLEDIVFNIGFDILIETNDNIKYQGNVKLELPAENLTTNGSDNYEITNFDDVIFKRV